MLLKKHICCGTDQSGDPPIFPSEKPKPLPYANFDPKKFSTYYSLFRTEKNTATKENEQQDYIDKKV